jgi:hypothetical protein
MKKHITVCLPNLLILLFSLIQSQDAQCADWVTMRPIAKDWLVLEISDGTVNLHISPATTGQDTYQLDTLDLNKIKELQRFTVSSADDPNYTQALAIIAMGRKSKTGPFPDIWPTYPYILKH